MGALACGLLAPLGSRASDASTAADEYLDPATVTGDVARVWSQPGNRRLAIILPPYGGDHHYYDSSRIPALLAELGIDFAVLFTEVTGYNRASDIARLDALIRKVMERHNYDSAKVVLGGFSAGGTGAFRYAMQKLQGDNLAILPAALISVDAPLDLERWCKGMQLVVERSGPDNPFYGECQYLTQMYRDMFGGTPQDKSAAYREASMLSASQGDGGNAKYFRQMPMRLYSEPDMDFFIRYGMDYASINASDQVSMASILTAQGNTDVSLVLTSGKGYRADLNNMRLPHSWSIVDEPDLARWIAARLPA